MMRTRLFAAGLVPILLGASLAGAGVRSGDVRLIGRAQIPGVASDLSGLDGVCGGDIPRNRLGSMGSGIAYTGRDNMYIMVDDRGPADGTVPFPCRMHEFRIEPPSGEGGVVEPLLLKTIMLKRSDGAEFDGGSGFFDPFDPAKDRRLDPEGVRVGPNGLVYVSDEYGPHIDVFSPGGVQARRLAVPAKFGVEHRDSKADEELPPRNTSGRQSNHGFEGVAITPAGDRLYAIVQSPLLQDHALDEHNKRIGTNLRILEITLESGRTRELLYQLDSSELCVNEMLAVNEHEFLVIERDRRIGAAARDKRVVRIDIGGASDISGIASLPAAGTPEGVTPVTKAPFIDLLSPAFGLAGADMPEKIEGLAFGPDLPDGRRLLIVTTDNDLKANEPTCFYLFAIDARDLAGFRAQRFAQGSH